MIFNMVGGAPAGGGFPEFTYTGTYQLIDDGKVGNKQNWRVKFLTSGTLTFTKDLGGGIDVFLVGGGGGGSDYYGHGPGGGGGYTQTLLSIVPPNKNQNVTITVGAGGAYNANGGNTSAFGFTVKGGKTHEEYKGGPGGSGGAGDNAVGGTDGNRGNPTSGEFPGGMGQGTTTKEFGESNGALYSGGGNTGRKTTNTGGNGRYGKPDGDVNTGGGGAGNDTEGQKGTGGSGIVIIRNHRG